MSLTSDDASSNPPIPVHNGNADFFGIFYKLTKVIRSVVAFAVAVAAFIIVGTSNVTLTY